MVRIVLQCYIFLYIEDTNTSQNGTNRSPLLGMTRLHVTVKLKLKHTDIYFYYNYYSLFVFVLNEYYGVMSAIL